MNISGGRMKRRRYLAGLTQDDLAKRANVARGTISHMEAGRSVSIESARQVAEALGCQIADLVAVEAPAKA